LREYYRALLAVDGKLGALLLADLAYVMLAVGSLAYVFWLGDASKQSVALVLLLLSAAGMSSVVWCLVPRKWPDLRALPSEMVDVFKKQMHEIRWSLLGVITTDIQNRGYIFVAAAFFGSATVGHLQAGRIFFGPLNLLTSSWARVARPQLAKLLGQGEAQRFDTTLKRAMWAFAGFNVLFLAGLWLAWPYLSALVFGAKYKGLGYMIAAWGVANMAFQIRSCLSIGVQGHAPLSRFDAGHDLGGAVVGGVGGTGLRCATAHGFDCSGDWRRMCGHSYCSEDFAPPCKCRH
jgi:O-antigen/teichoic acid export membrane protein